MSVEKKEIVTFLIDGLKQLIKNEEKEILNSSDFLTTPWWDISKVTNCEPYVGKVLICENTFSGNLIYKENEIFDIQWRLGDANAINFRGNGIIYKGSFLSFYSSPFAKSGVLKLENNENEVFKAKWESIYWSGFGWSVESGIDFFTKKQVDKKEVLHFLSVSESGAFLDEGYLSTTEIDQLPDFKIYDWGEHSNKIGIEVTDPDTKKSVVFYTENYHNEDCGVCKYNKAPPNRLEGEFFIVDNTPKIEGEKREPKIAQEILTKSEGDN